MEKSFVGDSKKTIEASNAWRHVHYGSTHVDVRQRRVGTFTLGNWIQWKRRRRRLYITSQVNQAKERASRIWKHCSYRHSDFYQLITLLMSSIELHLSNKPKQVFFNPINIFDTFTHSITLLYIFNILFSFNVKFCFYRLQYWVIHMALIQSVKHLDM